jgi:hypothetical protein
VTSTTVGEVKAIQHAAAERMEALGARLDQVVASVRDTTSEQDQRAGRLESELRKLHPELARLQASQEAALASTREALVRELETQTRALRNSIKRVGKGGGGMFTGRGRGSKRSD